MKKWRVRKYCWVVYHDSGKPFFEPWTKRLRNTSKLWLQKKRHIDLAKNWLTHSSAILILHILNQTQKNNYADIKKDQKKFYKIYLQANLVLQQIKRSFCFYQFFILRPYCWIPTTTNFVVCCCSTMLLLFSQVCHLEIRIECLLSLRMRIFARNISFGWTGACPLKNFNRHVKLAVRTYFRIYNILKILSNLAILTWFVLFREISTIGFLKLLGSNFEYSVYLLVQKLLHLKQIVFKYSVLYSGKFSKRGTLREKENTVY